MAETFRTFIKLPELCLYVCLTYIVPENSSRNVCITTSVYDRVLLHIAEISTACNGACTSIVLGDLNSRVGNLVDYVENDYFNRHVNLLPDDYNYDVPLLRSSRDSVINTYGRNLIDFCKESRLHILNGSIGEDAGIGDYTWL